MASGTRALRNFHLPLPEEIYLALRAEAEGMKQPATLVARQAIEAWLRDRKKTALHEAIAAYATQHAGTEVDLDPPWRKQARKCYAAECAAGDDSG